VLSDYAHKNGMRFGVYTDRGTQTCGGRAAALNHETADANFYARNGVGESVRAHACACALAARAGRRAASSHAPWRTVGCMAHTLSCAARLRERGQLQR
jgi:hypothetical protein